MTASAPQPATFLGMFGQADGRNHHHASFFELGDQVGLGRQRERRDPDPLADQQVDAIVGVPGVGADVDAERFVSSSIYETGGGFPSPLDASVGSQSHTAQPWR